MSFNEKRRYPARHVAIILTLLTLTLVLSLTTRGRASSNGSSVARASATGVQRAPAGSTFHTPAWLRAEPAALILLGCAFVILGRTLRSSRQTGRGA